MVERPHLRDNERSNRSPGSESSIMDITPACEWEILVRTQTLNLWVSIVMVASNIVNVADRDRNPDDPLRDSLMESDGQFNPDYEG